MRMKKQQMTALRLTHKNYDDQITHKELLEFFGSSDGSDDEFDGC